MYSLLFDGGSQDGYVGLWTVRAGFYEWDSSSRDDSAGTLHPCLLTGILGSETSRRWLQQDDYNIARALSPPRFNLGSGYFDLLTSAIHNSEDSRVVDISADMYLEQGSHVMESSLSNLDYRSPFASLSRGGDVLIWELVGHDDCGCVAQLSVHPDLHICSSVSFACHSRDRNVLVVGADPSNSGDKYAQVFLSDQGLFFSSMSLFLLLSFSLFFFSFLASVLVPFFLSLNSRTWMFS